MGKVICYKNVQQEIPIQFMDLTETDFKNRAYAFIMAIGLMSEYKRFCEISKDIEAHKLCNMIIMSRLENN